VNANGSARRVALVEPFSALNPALRDDLRRHLSDAIRDWDFPAVMITHDVDDVVALADVAFVVEQRARVAARIRVRIRRISMKTTARSSTR